MERRISGQGGRDAGWSSTTYRNGDVLAAQIVPYKSFAHLNIRMGAVLAAERMVHSKKLIALWMDVGEPKPRCLITGSKRPRPPESFVGLQLPVVCNLPPRELAVKVSQGLPLTT